VFDIDIPFAVSHLFSPTLPVAALFRERSDFVVRHRTRDTELAAGDYCLRGRT
jgi:hypothetical protein